MPDLINGDIARELSYFIGGSGKEKKASRKLANNVSNALVNRLYSQAFVLKLIRFYES